MRNVFAKSYMDRFFKINTVTFLLSSILLSSIAQEVQVLLHGTNKRYIFAMTYSYM